MTQKRARSPSPSASPATIFRSSSIQDRSSTFIGAYSKVQSATELQALPDFESATHRIAAWRVPSNQKTLIPGRNTYTTGHDDDGESYAGHKLENLLKNQDVTGSVVVARWYGGVMLGPVRFTHIEECAKEAIEKFREDVEGRVKRQRTEAEDRARREALAKTLTQRDESIVALRGLLAEKQGREPPKQTMAPIYLTMALPVLEKLEKARDKTIEFLLKGLDRADQTSTSQNTRLGEKTTSEDAAHKDEATCVMENRNQATRSDTTQSGCRPEPQEKEVPFRSSTG